MDFQLEAIGKHRLKHLPQLCGRRGRRIVGRSLDLKEVGLHRSLSAPRPIGHVGPIPPRSFIGISDQPREVNADTDTPSLRYRNRPRASAERSAWHAVRAMTGQSYRSAIRNDRKGTVWRYRFDRNGGKLKALSGLTLHGLRHSRLFQQGQVLFRVAAPGDLFTDRT